MKNKFGLALLVTGLLALSGAANAEITILKTAGAASAPAPINKSGGDNGAIKNTPLSQTVVPPLVSPWEAQSGDPERGGSGGTKQQYQDGGDY